MVGGDSAQHWCRVRPTGIIWLVRGGADGGYLVHGGVCARHQHMVLPFATPQLRVFITARTHDHVYPNAYRPQPVLGFTGAVTVWPYQDVPSILPAEYGA